MAEADGKHGLADTGKDSERLQHLRAVLPCEVHVTSALHPLCGKVLRASRFKRWDKELMLVVELPDGSSGTIYARATDIFGEQGPTGPATVLSVDGLRRLKALVSSIRPAGGSAHGSKRANRLDQPLYAPTDKGK
jgi:hypothetical protein